MDKELLHKAGAYCSAAEHCESEVRAKLTAWGAQETDIQEIIAYLYKENYLSAERYCRAYVHDKLLYQGWGRQKMSMMLYAKGLPKEAIIEALNDIDKDEYMRVLQVLADKKMRTLCTSREDAKTQKNAKEKVVRHLLSRGFSYREIEKAVR